MVLGCSLRTTRRHSNGVIDVKCDVFDIAGDIVFQGLQVAVAATVNLTPVTLELGGKDPAIILPGTELEKWISVWMRGI